MCENVLNACNQNLIISWEVYGDYHLFKICSQEKIIFKKVNWQVEVSNPKEFWVSAQ